MAVLPGSYEIGMPDQSRWEGNLYIEQQYVGIDLLNFKISSTKNWGLFLKKIQSNCLSRLSLTEAKFINFINV